MRRIRDEIEKKVSKIATQFSTINDYLAQCRLLSVRTNDPESGIQAREVVPSSSK